ncbi:MAG TPA: glycosyltransferase family 4 protein [Gaiellaceae bacterium]|nr:glycosyltransferase family 4 protein [Gaiellaceae bacterium]
MRVVLADPAGFTPSYDHELAVALARAGAEVELVTSPFRFGVSSYAGDGYRRNELFYGVSSRVFRRSRLRVPVKVLEHPVGTARLLRRPRDVLHVQWFAAAPLDRWLFRARGPLVFTAHDLLPRRTVSREQLWRELFVRFDRIVVHSERGLETLAEFGVPRDRLRKIPMPVFPSEPRYEDDGHTLSCIGLIRPYKGLGDAIEAAKRVDGARLIVAGEALEPVAPYRAAAGPLPVDWRCTYQSEPEITELLARTTVTLFPYKPEIDMSAVLMRSLGAGVPAIVYDIGGLAEPVREFGAGRVVAGNDVEGLTAAIEELLGDPAALDDARAGARRVRDALTWDASAAAHLDLYRGLVR